MKGQLLNFNTRESQGVISGDDGNRYNFISSEWHEETTPQKGMQLDFLVTENMATEVYIDSSFAITNKDENWYKSSDSKLIAGVCSGLATKFDVSTLGIRIATVVVSIFFLFPVILYIVLWLLLPAKATKF